MPLDMRNYDPALMQGANIGVAVDLTDIVDNNGNEVIEIDGVASAVNYLGVGNSATGNPVILVSRGDDTNVGLTIDAKGSGTIVLAGTSTGGITLTTAVTAASSVKSTSATAGVGYGTGAGGAVTQATSASTGVTLNTITGRITTVALTTAAGAEEEFTVTNSAIAATDVVVVGTTYTGAGTPAVIVKGIAAGSFVINIMNLHDANALNAAVGINFAIIKGVNA